MSNPSMNEKNKMTGVTTAKGYIVTRSDVGTWGFPERVYCAYEPSSLMGRHGTLFTIEGTWYGTLASRRIPAEIDALPVGPERWSACDAFRKANYDESYAAIVEVFPEAADGERMMGEVRLAGPIPGVLRMVGK